MVCHIVAILGVATIVIGVVVVVIALRVSVVWFEVVEERVPFAVAWSPLLVRCILCLLVCLGIGIAAHRSCVDRGQGFG